MSIDLNINLKMYVFARPSKNNPSGYEIAVEKYFWEDMGILLEVFTIEKLFRLHEDEMVVKLQDFIEKKAQKVKAEAQKELVELEEERGALLALTFDKSSVTAVNVTNEVKSPDIPF